MYALPLIPSISLRVYIPYGWSQTIDYIWNYTRRTWQDFFFAYFFTFPGELMFFVTSLILAWTFSTSRWVCKATSISSRIFSLVVTEKLQMDTFSNFERPQLLILYQALSGRLWWPFRVYLCNGFIPEGDWY